MVALSVSLDELAVGFTLGLLHIPILLACVLIALQAFTLTLIGTAPGSCDRQKSGEASGLLSGLVLTATGAVFARRRSCSALDEPTRTSALTEYECYTGCTVSALGGSRCLHRIDEHDD